MAGISGTTSVEARPTGRARRRRCRTGRGRAGPSGARSSPPSWRAWTMGTSMPAAASRASTASNRSSCSVGVGALGLVGHGQVRPHRRRDGAPDRSTIRRASGHHLVRRRADRCMPVSTFRCTSRHGTEIARRARRGGDGLRGADRERQVVGERRPRGRRPGPRPGRGSASSMPARRSDDALLDDGDRERRRLRRPSAACATATAPWPYPSAFTTTQSSAGSIVCRSVATLARIASRSTTTVVGTGGRRGHVRRLRRRSRAHRARNEVGKVTGDEAPRRASAGGAPVQVRSRGGRLERRHAHRQRSADHPRQHVARPGRGESLVAGPHDGDPAVGRGDDRRRSLQQRHRAAGRRRALWWPRCGRRRAGRRRAPRTRRRGA